MIDVGLGMDGIGRQATQPATHMSREAQRYVLQCIDNVSVGHLDFCKVVVEPMIGLCVA